jgi:hypothetical protein
MVRLLTSPSPNGRDLSRPIPFHLSPRGLPAHNLGEEWIHPQVPSRLHPNQDHSEMHRPHNGLDEDECTSPIRKTPAARSGVVV